jgi:hypothetical protein
LYKKSGHSSLAKSEKHFSEKKTAKSGKLVGGRTLCKKSYKKFPDLKKKILLINNTQ